MRSLLFLLMLVSTYVQSAGLELVVPVYTKHIQYFNEVPLTEDYDNRGIGVNLNIDDYIDYGFVYIGKDSTNEESAYAYGIVYSKTPIKAGIGLAFTSKTKEDPQQREYVKTRKSKILPVIALRYGWARISTTLPFGAMTGQSMDLLTVQLVLPLTVR